MEKRRFKLFRNSRTTREWFCRPSFAPVNLAVDSRIQQHSLGAELSPLFSGHRWSHDLWQFMINSWLKLLKFVFMPWSMFDSSMSHWKGTKCRSPCDSAALRMQPTEWPRFFVGILKPEIWEKQPNQWRSSQKYYLLLITLHFQHPWIRFKH